MSFNKAFYLPLVNREEEISISIELDQIVCGINCNLCANNLQWL